MSITAFVNSQHWSEHKQMEYPSTPVVFSFLSTFFLVLASLPPPPLTLFLLAFVWPFKEPRGNEACPNSPAHL